MYLAFLVGAFFFGLMRTFLFKWYILVMLTERDLKKIDILFTKRIGEEFKRELEPVKKDISGIKSEVVGVKQELEPMKKDIAGIKGELVPIKKDIVEIRKDQKTIVSFFDTEYLDLRDRVEVIERRLNIGL